MQKTRLILGFFLLAASFFIFILSLLAFFPKLLAGALLFFSIFYLVSTISNRHRFRGFG